MDQAEPSREAPETPQAWTLHLGAGARVERYVVTIPNPPGDLFNMQPGDGVILTYFGAIRSIAKIYRVRSEGTAVQIQLAAHRPIRIEHTMKVPDRLASFDGVAEPLDWAIFEAVITSLRIPTMDAFQTINHTDREDQAYVRELLTTTLSDDLLGPAMGPYEQVVGVNVRDRYLIGKLAPADTKPTLDLEPTDLLAGKPDKNDPTQVENTITAQSLIPASMGMTFCVPADLAAIHVDVTWGHYERTREDSLDPDGNHRAYAWQREPTGGSAVISLDKPSIFPIPPDPNFPKVVLKGSVSKPHRDGVKLVSLFLVNTQTKPSRSQDEAWVFQPAITVESIDGQPVFIRKPSPDEHFDEEVESLNMLYRNRVEFAVGHGVSVHAEPSDTNPAKATRISTTFLPAQEVNTTEAAGNHDNDRPNLRGLAKAGLFDMKVLADLAVPDKCNTLVAGLTHFVDDYDRWINEQRDRIGQDLNGYAMAAADTTTQCQRIRDRLRESIEVLRDNPDALKAFRFTNQAMAAQRIRAQYALARRQGKDVTPETFNKPKNRSWRPFQLAFVLLAIPALADPAHPERANPEEAIADLLWFPTGGGKTEAYLGVAAFAMAIRRLQHEYGGLDASHGLTVIMRYTLRLLTLQQFQRAAGLICAMEVIRLVDPDTWGTTPFTIGLWVGGKNTPNSFKASHDFIEAMKAGQKTSGVSPLQLTTCPWCGSALDVKTDVVTDPLTNRTHVYCSDATTPCPFSKAADITNPGIPVLTVDEEMYHHPPSILIATVDKFAQMAWQPQVRTLFGLADQRCERHGLLWPDGDCRGNHGPKGDWPQVHAQAVRRLRPPDLIIQDEFHLISGPLGTMVGLYETAVDQLCSWNYQGKTVTPKVVASTATVRKADDQIKRVFARQMAVFPPNGVDVEDNFFAIQRPTKTHPGRLYLGICPMGISRPAVMSRVYTTLLTAAQSLHEALGLAADPYMSLVGYFNALRDLGGMRRACDDEVSNRTRRITAGETQRPGLAPRYINMVRELTSRVSNHEIPKYLDHLEVPFNPDSDNPQRPIDIVLATNMLSVGVDVNRIGLMVMAGQPKSAAEYIQATSRVGRAFPGLVCTVLNWSRPRDLSHYETFEHYHQTFYKHVEAQSVTPFSARALDRGLAGVLVSTARLANPELNPNGGAGQLTRRTRYLVDATKERIIERAGQAKDDYARELTEAMLDERIAHWAERAGLHGRQLKYRGGTRDEVPGLMAFPQVGAWGLFTVPNSMREVEAPVALIMNTDRFYRTEPDWEAQPQHEEAEDA